MATNIEKARTGLLIRHPFFGSIVLKTPFTIGKGADFPVPTAAASRDGKIFINEDFANKLSIDELRFVIAHEAMHIAMAHVARTGNRDHAMWNIACDAVVNGILKREGVGTPIHGAVFIDGADELSAEQVYAKFGGSKNSQAQQGSGGQQHIPKPGIPDLNNKAVDAHANGKPPSPMSDADAAKAIAQSKVTMAQAAATARMCGKGSEFIDRLVGSYVQSRLPWWEILERFVQSRASQAESWSRPNRKFRRYAYLPSMQPEPSMGELVVGIDVSGSIGLEELQEFFGHVVGIAEQVHPERVHVLYTSTSVGAVDSFADGEELTLRSNPPSDGGTWMPAIHEWAEQNAPDADCIVIFTDGYTETMPEGGTPVVWVCTTNALSKKEGIGMVLATDHEDRS